MEFDNSRIEVTEEDRLRFMKAAYVADPNTKRIIDTRDSTIRMEDIHLIRQGLEKLNGERPMNAPRLPVPVEPSERSSIITEEDFALAESASQAPAQ